MQSLNDYQNPNLMEEYGRTNTTKNPNGGVDSPSEFFRLPAEDQATVMEGVRAIIAPARRILRFHSTYSLKQRMKVYVTNGIFKGACLSLGIRVADTKARNWRLYAKFVKGK